MKIDYRNFDKYRKYFIEHIEECSQKPVVLFNDNEDKLETNYTLNFFPDKIYLDRIKEVIDLFQNRFPNHKYMETDKLHVTLVGMIPISENVDNILETSKNFLPKKISFYLKGVDTSSKVSSLLAFPVDFDLQQFRTVMRKEISKNILHYSKIYRRIGWMNFVRFIKQPEPEFFELLSEYVNFDLGEITGEIRLLKNDSRTLEGSEVISIL